MNTPEEMLDPLLDRIAAAFPKHLATIDRCQDHTGKKYWRAYSTLCTNGMEGDSLQAAVEQLIGQYTPKVLAEGRVKAAEEALAKAQAELAALAEKDKEHPLQPCPAAVGASQAAAGTQTAPESS